MAAPLGVRHIGQIAMPARNLDRAVAFYRDVLGLPFLFQVPSLAFFDCDGTRLMLSTPETDEVQHHGSTLYFSVDDIQAAWQTLRQHQVNTVDEPHLIAQLETVDVWMGFFNDSEGNLLALMSETPRAYETNT
ncbi:MAG TPA: VOC family protein [Roseiflexaceae bacterium]|nr:VOC family protein [Roseiflexaceae bacterium]